MRRMLFCASLVVALLGFGAHAPPTHALPTQTPQGLAPAVYVPLLLGPPRFEDKVFVLINQQRAALAPSCPQLVLNLQLEQAAEGHSQDMAVRDFFSHTNPSGATPSTRAQAAGYPLWNMVGENIAAGQSTPQEVVTSWMASTGHRNNILNCSYRSTGIGYAYDPTDTFGPYRHYWTQMFGPQ